MLNITEHGRKTLLDLRNILSAKIIETLDKRGDTYLLRFGKQQMSKDVYNRLNIILNEIKPDNSNYIGIGLGFFGGLLFGILLMIIIL